MGRIILVSAAAFVLALVAEGDAMAGGGGPWDRWRSPYALTAPQSFPSTAEDKVIDAVRSDQVAAAASSRVPPHPAKKKPARRRIAQ